MEKLLDFIRKSFTSPSTLQHNTSHSIKYDSKISQLYISLFQKGNKPIRWGAKRDTLENTLIRIIKKIKTNPRFCEFYITDTNKCRIMLEIVTKQYDCDINNITTMKMYSINRFEPGVNGLKYTYNGINRFFMPTDGYTKSIMNVNQLLNYMSKQCGIAKKTNKISQRVSLMKSEPITYSFIESKAYITHKDKVLSLTRGFPDDKLEISNEILLDKTLKSVDWLVSNMNSDGSFMYYYDPYKDSVVDDMHPKMTDPLYNNILRHSGGTISLLRAYELSKNSLYLEKANHSIEFLLSTFKSHTYNDEFACYPFFNKKSKLGGAGLALVAMMHYFIQSGNNKNRDKIDGLVRHILSRIDKDGEMLGYYIHPNFNNGEPLININNDIKKELFSFYYPGEALLGLALYYRYIKDLNPTLKIEIKEKSELALDFLVDIRPIKYSHMFAPLPSDAWLMQAIEEWVQVDGLKKKNYIDFVFNDAEVMFEHMYTKDNVTQNTQDYIGGFFYNYGDHVYHDASRCEGIISAYYLALYLNDEKKAEWIMQHIILSAKGLMKTFHSDKSTYSHIDTSKSLHSFRFKLTRQWVRVDSVQHAACFFARLIPTIEKKVLVNDLIIDNKYKVITLLDQAGYSKVYKVLNINNQKVYALKLINESRYINLLMNENKILNIMNNHSSIKYHKFGYHKKSVYFLFDYAPDGNLKNYVKKHGSFNNEMINTFILTTIDSLLYAKNNNILHLDIKPANILYSNNQFTLSDWGNSIQSNSCKTVHLKANPVYLAPEFYYGQRGFESEIYSLGCTIYFLLTSEHPFSLRYRDSLVKKMYFHIYVKPDLSKIKSKKIQHLLFRMLDKNPDTRIKLEEISELLNQNEYPIISNTKTANIDCSNEYKLYEIMAKDNISFAQDKIAKLILNSNLEEAIYWLKKASSQGFANAQNKLGLVFFIEKYNKQDFNEAFNYFILAANQNHDMSLYYLGLMYEKGIYVKQNYDESIKYFIASAKNAYKPAYKKLKELNIDIDIHSFQNSIILQFEEMAIATNGYWENIDKTLTIHGINYLENFIKKGDLFITFTPNQWKEKKTSNEKDINKAISNGAVAVMIREESKISTNIPTLRVKNTKKAFQQIAEKTTKLTKATKILVTGSYGKTGFKINMSHILQNQLKVNAIPNSSNQSAGIFKAISSIRNNDELAIIEVAVPPNKGKIRSSFVQPDICVITSIGHEHIEKHGSIESLVKHKVSVVSSLKKNGKVIIPRDDKYYHLIKKELAKYPDLTILTFGTTKGCNALLIKSDFDNYGWNIKAKIEDTIVEYRINFIESHAPVNSLSVLLCTYYLDVNLKKAASNYINLNNSKSSGILHRLNNKNTEFLFYDQSYRGGIESFIEFFKTITLLKPKNNGKKVVITSEFVDYKDGEMENIDTTLFQDLIKKANIDIYHSVENFYMHEKVLNNTNINTINNSNLIELKNTLLSYINNDDIICIKGIYESELPELSETIISKYKKGNL